MTVRKLSRRLPGAFRALALLAFLLGSLIGYLDAQKAADRRMLLSHDAPVPRSLDETLSARSNERDFERAVVAEAADPLSVSYWQGLARQRALVFPLRAEPGGMVRGYAWLDAGFADHATIAKAAETGIWRGLEGVPTALDAAARAAMRQAGLTVADELVPVSLFDGPRAKVLGRVETSNWRAVFYWLAAAAFMASYILKVELSRIDAERSRRAVVGDWQGLAGQEPETEKARSRFEMLSEVEEDAPEPEAPPLLFRAMEWAGRMLRRLPRWWG